MSGKSNRAGYAMTLVIVFIVLFLSLLSLAYHQTAAALRVESIRDLQRLRDEGSTHAMARALALLETGEPPSSPYVCGVTIDTYTGPRPYTLTFTAEAEGRWSVHAELTQPGDDPQPLPDSFAQARQPDFESGEWRLALRWQATSAMGL